MSPGSSTNMRQKLGWFDLAHHAEIEIGQLAAIVMKNLKMRYRPDTPLVLKGLNVKIGGGERIGVVGRTGSGKSSLLLTLLRLVEPSLEQVTEEEYEAPIEIDGVDILRIGLRDLRTRLGIIPQNPVVSFRHGNLSLLY